MWRSALLVAMAGCGRWGFADIDAQLAGDAHGGDATPSDGPSTGDAVASDAPAGSVVATFGETPGATFQGVTADTYLSNDTMEVGHNFGASTSLAIESGQKISLLRFDLAAIASGKAIVAARLQLYVTQGSGNTIAIAPVKESWTEGTLSNATGVANWTQRSSSASWTTAGAGSPGSAGATIASVSASAGAIGVDLPVATVQGWVNTPGSNFGISLAPTGGADTTLASSNATTATTRPSLVVTYFP